MARRILVSLLSAALLLAAVPAAALGADPPLPRSMAAVGDSITQAASSAGSLGADAPQNSWSTGSASGVNSHYLRLLAAGAPISGQAFNRSVSGAKVADLATQMAAVVPLQPDYLTVLIGGNDVCTDTVEAMTPETTFREAFAAAMATLAAGSPTTRVYVVSIPDVYQLWSLFRGNWWARFVWSSAGICQSLLANPTSTLAADVARREAVRARTIAYNTRLAEVCAAYVQCRWDGNAAFNTAFTTADVSGDYFHPSATGQAKLAAVSWAAGYTWAPPPPTPIWVTAMSGSAAASRTGWTASATVSVSGPTAGVTVAIAWSTGASTTCVTTSSGACTTSIAVGKKTPSVTATVTSLARSGSIYDPTRDLARSLTINR